MMQKESFTSAFRELTGHKPFLWQERLFQAFCSGTLPTLDLPTGLAKTSVMAIWYLALKATAPVPRRLVYVVDRRAVVDQATTVAEAIRNRSRDDSLRLSTLRGQYVDNREWLADPTGRAIVVVTVDMIGSRLLFSGYGVSSKMRPYYAGLLGVDTLVVLDEAHLVPPFEALLKSIARERSKDLLPGRKEDKIVPHFRLMSLTATGRDDKEADGETQLFQLADSDYKYEIVRQRLNARKALTIDEVKDAKALVDELVTRAWALGTMPRPARVLVYCNNRSCGRTRLCPRCVGAAGVSCRQRSSSGLLRVERYNLVRAFRAIQENRFATRAPALVTVAQRRPVHHVIAASRSDEECRQRHAEIIGRNLRRKRGDCDLTHAEITSYILRNMCGD